MKAKAYRDVGALKAEFQLRRDAIEKRLDEFAAVPPSEFFYELVYCLLTPQTSAVNAGKAVDALVAANFKESEFDPARVLHQKSFYIRFHNTKGRHLLAAKRQFPDIQGRLSEPYAGAEHRLWLVNNVKGLGWKEASHFLRNIGYRNLAILDRHILRNLKRHGAIRSLPATLTPKRYLRIEKQFARFAEDIGISMDEIDLLFWSRETGVLLK